MADQPLLYLWRLAVRQIYGKILALQPPEGMRESAKRGWLFYRERIERMANRDATESVFTQITLKKDGTIRVNLVGPGRTVTLEPTVDYELNPTTWQIELTKSADELWEEKT